jgi:hypothetical protein
MATVHIGRLLGPVGFARTVAIKRLHPPLAKDPEFVAMFLDEARLAARIHHPNVVSTLDVVATEGELFVVMEYVPGESLARLLRVMRTAKEMMPVPIAATIMVGVLHGLHAAHEAHDERGEPLRIVHRDVSPHNILVGTDGDAHLIDFGIAKARGRMQVTRQGQVKGKLSYMPPEQLMGQGLDHRADIFAASIVLWESLTGQRLFQGADDGDVYAKVLLCKVDPPSLHAKGLSPAIDAIVLRGLARDRTQRYETAREMALAIEAAIPLAPPSHVGRWVEELVGDSLAERTEQIAGIERLVDGNSDATSSALMTIGEAGARRPANEQNDGIVTGARATTLGRTDRTGPTQPLGAPATGMSDPTVVDRPAVAPAATDSLGDAIAAPRRRPRLVMIALFVLTVGAYGGLHALRGTSHDGATTSPGSGDKVGAIEAHETTAGLPQPPSQTAASGLPVPASSPSLREAQASDDAQARTEATAAPKRAATQAATGARSVAPRGPSTAAPLGAPAVVETSPGTHSPRVNASSCEPPFYIDADGTKRYKRYCTGL